jgi:hypothetical protein
MNPYLTDGRKRIQPTGAQPCLRCDALTRKAYIVTEVTVMLDANPTIRGSYYYETEDGLVLEDVVGTLPVDKYRRHRCMSDT